jgi:hypothetical protein
LFTVLESLDNTDICVKDTLPQRVDIIDELVVHRIGCYRPSLSQYTHGRIQVRLELHTNRQRNVSEASEDGNLYIPIQDVASQIFRQDTHEGAGVIYSLWAESTRDITNEADGDTAELTIFVSFEGRVEERKEGGDVRSEVMIQT